MTAAQGDAMDLPTMLPPCPVFDAIVARSVAAGFDQVERMWNNMEKRPSGVAASQSMATDIGRTPGDRLLRDNQGWVEVSPHTAIRVLQDEVDRLRTERRWISVSERLPPLMTEVLGWHQADRVRAWFRHSGQPLDAPYWELWEPQDRECDDCKVKAPTHWMPLPEPPSVT